jgi:hypothetical protein
MLIFSLVALVGLMVALNVSRTDWRGPTTIQIGYRTLPQPGPNAVEPLVFLLDRKWRLTSVRVVSADEARTNAHPRALWDLVSKDGSEPVTHLHYGADLPGMKPRYPGIKAEKLDPQHTYLVRLDGEGRHGEREFTLKPGAPSR